MKSTLILLSALALCTTSFAQNTGGSMGSNMSGSSSGNTTGDTNNNSGSMGTTNANNTTTTTTTTTRGANSNTTTSGSSDMSNSTASTSGGMSDSNTNKSAQHKGETQVSDIASNPQKFVNKHVTVSGEVQNLADDNKSFVLNDQNSPTEQVLVISKSAKTVTAKDIKDNDQVRLSGKVQKMNAKDIERKFSVKLNSSLKDQMSSEMPVIVSDASSFKVIKPQ